MYNWPVLREHYIDIAEEHGPSLMANQEFGEYFMKNLTTILTITSNISKSPMWEGIQIKAAQRSNVIDMVSSLFMGMTIPIKDEKEVIPDIKSFKESIDFYSGLSEEVLYAHLSKTMQVIVQNINDVLNEFHVVIANSQTLHYLEVTKIMYLTGIFLGNAFVYAKDHPEGQLEITSNVFVEYIQYLQKTFQELEARGKHD